MSNIDLTNEDVKVIAGEPGPESCNPLQYWDVSAKRCKLLQIYFGNFSDLFKISMRSTAIPAEEEASVMRRQRVFPSGFVNPTTTGDDPENR